MSISGRRDTFSKGRLDDADVQFSNTRWEMIESKKTAGTENPWLLTDFIDADGQEHPQRWIALGGAGRGTRLAVVDGKLCTLNDDGDEVEGGSFSENSAVAKLFDSLEELGFSGKKLAKVGDEPEVLDGQWAHVEQKPSGRKAPDGTEYSDLVVTALLDEDEVEKSTKKKSSKPAVKKTTKKAEEEEEEEEERPRKKKPAAEEEEEEEEEPKSAKGKGGKSSRKEPDEDETTDEDTDEDAEETDEGPEYEEAREVVATILSTPADYVKNFNAKKNDGGITVKEAYNASFGVYKGKHKGPVTTLISKADFHAANDRADLYRFDEESGILYPKITKKGGKK